VTDAVDPAAELERVHRGDAEGEAFHGRALLPTLRGVSAETAAARPIAAAHTLWEVVLHVIAWREWTTEALRGGRPGDLDADGWTAVADATPAAWSATLARLEASQRALVEAVRALPSPRTPRQDQLVRFVLHHDLHHGGQIGLLRRA
jgi:uncharacterized damage-inducible protein DinB